MLLGWIGSHCFATIRPDKKEAAMYNTGYYRGTNENQWPFPGDEKQTHNKDKGNLEGITGVSSESDR